VTLDEARAEIDDLRGQLSAVTQVKRWAASAAQKPRNRTARKPKHQKHLLIPDTQVKLGVDISHIAAAGNYAAEKRPDVITIIGDWWDFPSLSSYDRGKLCFEGRRYRSDVEAGKVAMEKFLAPIRKVRGYRPRIIFTLGNHEHRVQRVVDEDARLEGAIGIEDLKLAEFGLETYAFLKPVVVDGIAYCHFFPRSATGRVMQNKSGAPNARAQLVREGRSCMAGHMQGFDIHGQSIGGRMQYGVIAGSFYSHDEGYLTPQGNDHWRGLFVAHEVCDGYFSPMVVTLDYLLAEYL
jgi:hypothetical protein